MNKFEASSFVWQHCSVKSFIVCHLSSNIWITSLVAQYDLNFVDLKHFWDDEADFWVFGRKIKLIIPINSIFWIKWMSKCNQACSSICAVQEEISYEKALFQRWPLWRVWFSKFKKTILALMNIFWILHEKVPHI